GCGLSSYSIGRTFCGRFRFWSNCRELCEDAMSYRGAVGGGTGNVGREMLTTLAERQFPVKEVIPLASSRSVGQEVSYGEDDVLKVRDLAKFDFKGVDIVLSSPGAKVSAEVSPKA